MKVYRQGRYSVPESPTWSAVQWRVDVPDWDYRFPFAEHAYLRGTTVSGAQWFYCLRHRGWEPADG